MTFRLLQSLPKMSLAISIVVVICMAISFAALFLLYGRTKAKGVSCGVEDKQLLDGLADKMHKRGERGESGLTYAQMLEDGRRRERIVRIITDAVLFVFIAAVGALTIFSFVLRSKGEQVYFGDTAYITVLTASMQDKNENNAYLKENDDGVRIHQYALIGIDKCDPATLKEGDIIAFKYSDGTIYVHRIVSVREVDGEKLFTTMGDANDVSAPNETDISADRIVGVFNGYHKGYLGILLIYMRSDIGMVALIFVFLLLAVVDAAELIITRSYEKRQLTLADDLDSRNGQPDSNGYGAYTPDDGYFGYRDYAPGNGNFDCKDYAPSDGLFENEIYSPDEAKYNGEDIKEPHEDTDNEEENCGEPAPDNLAEEYYSDVIRSEDKVDNAVAAEESEPTDAGLDEQTDGGENAGVNEQPADKSGDEDESDGFEKADGFSDPAGDYYG